MFPDVDFHWFPLENPGIISIPVGFLLGVVGTLPVQGAAGRRQVRRAGGPVPDRHRAPTDSPRSPPRRGRVVDPYDAAASYLVGSGPVDVSGVT